MSREIEKEAKCVFAVSRRVGETPLCPKLGCTHAFDRENEDFCYCHSETAEEIPQMEGTLDALDNLRIK